MPINPMSGYKFVANSIQSQKTTNRELWIR